MTATVIARSMCTVMAVMLAATLASVGASPALAQTQAPAAPASTTADDDDEPRPFRFGGEVKAGFRSSRRVESADHFSFPANFLPAGQTQVFLRTVSPEPSFELVNLALIGEGDLTRGVAAKIEVHVLDLHNRNPTSSDDRVLLREAWVRFGKTYDLLEPVTAPTSTSTYVLVGLAPRFTKPLTRRLESYGLWTTAVGRFENPQVQAGGTIQKHAYWRVSVGNGNPVFIRDTNALAGDNGTPERVPGNVNPIYQSGFPILYDAKPQDLNASGQFEVGVGGGYRTAADDWAVDVMAWLFRRDLADTARIRGTYYSGDLKLLRGAGVPLPFSGNDKIERGVNADARVGRLRMFGQYVDQEIAKLPRRGMEVEAAYRIPLDGLFLVGETPVGNWVQPVVRYSNIDNRFMAPHKYPAPSVGWDWKKLDVGARVGVTSHVDVTAEYSFHSAQVYTKRIHPNETLVTMRVGF